MDRIRREVPPPTKKSRSKTVDTGKIKALRDAGWTLAKIGDEMGLSDATVHYYLKKMEAADGKDPEQVELEKERI